MFLLERQCFARSISYSPKIALVAPAAAAAFHRAMTTTAITAATAFHRALTTTAIARDTRGAFLSTVTNTPATASALLSAVTSMGDPCAEHNSH